MKQLFIATLFCICSTFSSFAMNMQMSKQQEPALWLQTGTVNNEKKFTPDAHDPVSLTLEKAVESKPLRRFINRYGSNTKDTALKVAFSKIEIEAFDKALDNIAKEIIDYNTLEIALRFKAAGLYSLCLKEALPPDVDKLIAHICHQQTRTIQNLKKSLIKYERTQHLVKENYTAEDDSIVMSNNGKYYALTSKNIPLSTGPIDLFDAREHKLLCSFTDHNRTLFHPHHNLLLLSNSYCETSPFNLIAYDIDTQTQIDIIKNDTDNKFVYNVCISADGRYFAVRHGESLRLWKIDQEKKIEEITLDSCFNNDHIGGFTFHPFSTYLLIATWDDQEQVTIYTYSLESLITTRNNKINIPQGNLILSIDFNHDTSLMLLKTAGDHLIALCNSSDPFNISLRFLAPQFKMISPYFIPQSNLISFFQYHQNMAQEGFYRLYFYDPSTNNITQYQHPVTKDVPEMIRSTYFFDKQNRIGIVLKQPKQINSTTNTILLIDPYTPDCAPEIIHFPISSPLYDFEQNQHDQLLCHSYSYNSIHNLTLCNTQGEKLLQLTPYDNSVLHSRTYQLSSGNYDQGHIITEEYLKPSPLAFHSHSHTANLWQWDLISKESSIMLNEIEKDLTTSQLVFCENLKNALKTNRQSELLMLATNLSTFNSLKEEQKPVILKIINHIKK